MAWLCQVTLIATTLLVFLPRAVWPAVTARPTPSVVEILERARPATKPPNSLTCRAYATITFEKHAPVALHLAYSFLAPHCSKVVVLSRFARPRDIDFFEHKVGMAYVFNGPRVTAYQPFFMRGQTIDAKVPEKAPVVSEVYGTGNMAKIGPWLASMLHVSRPENVKVRYVGVENVGGEKAYLIEFTFAHRVRPMLGHWVKRYVKWFSVNKGAPIRAVAYDDRGAIVAETVYEAFKQIAPDKWVALKTRKTIRAGVVALSRNVTVTEKNGKQTPATWSTTLPFPARTVVHEYEWIDGRVGLPRTIAVWDNSGKLIVHVRFFDYVLDAGLSRSEFEYEPMP